MHLNIWGRHEKLKTFSGLKNSGVIKLRLEKSLNIQDCLEKSLKIKGVLSSVPTNGFSSNFAY